MYHRSNHLRDKFRQMICTMLESWATSSMIESNDLIRKMFSLLLRQYIGVAEVSSNSFKTLTYPYLTCCYLVLQIQLIKIS